jgi:hypothetical protein
MPAPALQQNKYLLATCYRHCNQGYRAVHLLQGSNSQHCRYLAALCCLDLRQYKEAEQLLLHQGEAQVRMHMQLQQGLLQQQLRTAAAAHCCGMPLEKNSMAWVMPAVV